jgi:hypothetical protein
VRSSRAFLRALPLLLALFAWFPAWAQYELSVSIEPAQGIHQHQTLEFVIQVAGDSNPDVDTPRLKELTNLRAIGTPRRRISSNWVNGQFSAKVELRYTLEPEGPGKAEIPPIELQIDGKTYRTDPLSFVVAATSSARPPLDKPNSVGTGSSRDDSKVLLRAEIDTSAIWVGQAVPLSVLLYSDGPIGSAVWRNRPQLSSFWVEELEVDSEAEAFSETVGGRRYIVRPLLRKVLVPQTPGKFEVEPFALQIQVRGKGNDPFNVFSMSRGNTLVRRTDPISLTVKPLPTSHRPEGFGGAVGSFELSASLDHETTVVNDAVALKATVTGEGFLLAVSAPAFEAPAGIKLFDPDVRSSSEGREGKLISSKSWEWILVPNQPGEVRLPPLEFHFFDPSRGRYRTVRHEFAPLNVLRSDEMIDAPLARGKIRVLQQDLAFIKPLDGPLRVREPRAGERKLFLALALLPLAWVPLWIVLGRRRARLLRDVSLLRGRKAGRRARRLLRDAAKQRTEGESAAFHEGIARALVEYVADRFNRAAAGLTYETADDLLASRGLDEPLRRRFRSCLESCDFARFVPAAERRERGEEMLQEAEAIVDELEKAL